MKSLLLTGLILGATMTTFAQDAKHKNYFKEVEPVKTNEYKAVIVNSVSNMAYCKFGFKVTNLTTDFLIFRLNESTFTLDGVEHKMDNEKDYFVDPNKTKNLVYNATGNESVNYHVDKFDFALDGAYLLPADGEVIKAPNFKLPASTKEITFGDFEVTLKKLKKETKVTDATFEVTYKGDNYAIVNQAKLAVTIPEKGDDKFANNAKKKIHILTKGQTKTMRATFNISAKYSDVQFANMEIIWNDAFQVSVANKLEGKSCSFEIYECFTEGKN